MNWNQDNYGEPLEATGNYAGDRLGRMRATIAFLPIDQETLTNYIERLSKAVYELENISIQSHINGKKMWYTHRTPSQTCKTWANVGFVSKSTSQTMPATSYNNSQKK
jgi:hypothetical protein